MKLDLDELKKLALAATPGPWKVKLEPENDRYPVILDKHGSEVTFSTADCYCESNAIYLAEANPQTILRLCELIEVYEKLLNSEKCSFSVGVNKLDKEYFDVDVHCGYKKALEQKKRILGE